ncbi:MAG: hypothetical protein ACRDS0_02815 [Pseudonocardiaceae bacterium]
MIGREMPLQLLLDDDFKPKGTTTPENLEKLRAFATTVSNLVDSVYADLLSGNVNGWTGAKIAAFTLLLQRGHPIARIHAGNVVEERVYFLMRNMTFEFDWTEQFSEAMGGASKPDIVVHVRPKGGAFEGPAREGLIDVTSDRGHILAKAGGWTTSDRYVYLAEAYFPSVTKEDTAIIKRAFEAGGIDHEAAQKLKAEAGRARAEAAVAKKAVNDRVRKQFNQYNSFGAWYEHEGNKHGSKSDAAKFLREHGFSYVKGAPPAPKGPRGLSDEGKKKRLQAAVKEGKKRRQADLDKRRGLTSDADERSEDTGKADDTLTPSATTEQAESSEILLDDESESEDAHV